MINSDLQKQIRSLFDYRNGNLYWKVVRQGIRNGGLAGTVIEGGYRQVKIDGKSYYAHRLIFLYHHGYLPEFLDHIDRNPLNNNIENLRKATYQENGRNQKKTKSYNGKPTSSRFKGVTWFKQTRKWMAQITIEGKSKNLGYYDCEWLNSEHKMHVQENCDIITRYVEDLNEIKDRCQIVHDELENTLSYKLNRNMYMMAVIASIFLPLSFVTSLFGINVGGIPGGLDEFGFWWVCILLGVFVLIQIIVFKKLKWF